MQKNVYKQRLMLLLISLVLILCTGFFLISCGVSPQQKTEEIDRGPHAIDFINNCPVSGPSGICRLLLSSDDFTTHADRTIAGKELTVEAWVKSQAAGAASFTGGIVGRFDTAGIAIFVNGGVPKAVIRRVGASGSSTATADYIASSNMAAIADTLWHHIAGVLTADDHSAVHADCTNTTDTVDCNAGGVVCNNDIHLDIYVDGQYKDCNTTYGEDNDPLVTAPAFAEEPGDVFVAVGTFAEALSEFVDGIDFLTMGTFPGIIDEPRLWGTDRSQAEIQACMGQELSLDSGTCGRVNKPLIAYMKFNDGEGHEASEWSGVGTKGGLEYPSGGQWIGWDTGWTTDTPGLIAHE